LERLIPVSVAVFQSIRLRSALVLAAVCAASLLATGARAAVDEDLADLLAKAAAYESGQSMGSLRRLEELVRQSAADAEQRKELELGLTGLLTGQSTFEAKQFACQQLGIIGSEASIPALQRLLESEATAPLACQALSSHPSPKADDALRQGAQSLSGPAQLQVIGVLGARADPEAVGILSQLSAAPDAPVARAAVLALGKIANPPAREALARLRTGGRPELAEALVEASMNAAEKLARADDAATAAGVYRELLDSRQAANVRRGAFEALLQLDEDGGEKRILDTLRGTDPLLKPVAIAAMRRLRSESASEKFARAMPALPAQEQAWIVETLAARRDPAAREAVLGSLASPDLAVRMAAIEGLARTGEASAVGPLVAALSSESITPKERTAIERTLTVLPAGPDFDAALLHHLSKAGQPAARISLLNVAARRNSRGAFTGILEAAQSPDTAAAAFRALGDMAAAEDVPILLRKLLTLRVSEARSDAENAAAQALRKVPDPSRRAELVCGALDQARDPETRRSLLGLLPVCGDARALSVLSAACADPNAELQDAAIRALADWPDASAWEALAGIYRGSANEVHRVLSLNALVRLAEMGNARPDAGLMARYRELLENARTDDDRKLILSALSGAAHPEAVRLVEPLLANTAVREEAAVALRKITESLGK
jgi:HEAT repeat protein